MKYWVYVHTCPNGKKYVGITTQVPEKRWKEGKGYLFNSHFHQAIVKYGWNNIQHEAWEVSSESEMCYAEKYLISYYQTTKPKFGYNNRTGGLEGSKHTQPRKPVGEETRKKLSYCALHRSPEHRRKLSEANSRRWKDPEYRKNHSRKGIPMSESHREHSAEANRKRVVIKLSSGEIRTVPKASLTRWYINRGISFDYVS